MTYRRVDADPEADLVRQVTFVPFLANGCCVVRSDGRADLPTGVVRVGEHWLLDAALRIPLETYGFRIQRVHPVASEDVERGVHLYVFAEGAPYRGRREHVEVELTELAPERLEEWLRSVGEEHLGRVVGDAAEAYRNQSEESYHADNTRHLEPAYLRGRTPQEQSGKGGTAEEWRLGREHIVEGIDRDGTFLDMGCANGHLADCVRTWASERGHTIEPYGMDIGPKLVALARHRLPQWAERFWVGNALTWVPPSGQRFTFVHTLLDCVPRYRRGELIEHALAELVEPGGRLLVSQYSPEPGSTARQCVETHGFVVAGESSGGTAWIDG